MKKTLALLLLFALVTLTFTACGDDKPTESTPSGDTSSAESSDKLTVGGIIDDNEEWGPVVGLD